MRERPTLEIRERTKKTKKPYYEFEIRKRTTLEIRERVKKKRPYYEFEIRERTTLLSDYEFEIMRRRLVYASRPLSHFKLIISISNLVPVQTHDFKFSTCLCR
jgi:hypothetical protein